MDILRPKLDVVFKLIFNKEDVDILADFLLSVLDLDEREYEGIEMADTEFKREHIDDKLGILDVKLKTKSGKSIAVEIQIKNRGGMRPRVTYYLSKLITEQLESGDPYTKIKRAICIVITDFEMVEESENYHTSFQMLEKNEHFPFNDLLGIEILDLTKIPKNKSDKLINWLKFLKAEKEEEFEMCAQTSPAINRAYVKLKRLSADEQARYLYDGRMKALSDERTMVEDAELRGMAKGREEGREEGALFAQSQFINTMLKNGMEPKIIAQYLNLTEKEVGQFIS